MESAITKLKGFVQTYAGFNMDHLTPDEQDQLKGFVGETILLLKWEIENHFSSVKEEAVKGRYGAGIQEQLIYLANALTGFDMDDEKPQQLTSTAELVLVKIFELLEYLRTYFTAYFNFNLKLPDQFIPKFRSYYSIFEEKMIAEFGRLNVDPDLLTILQSYFEATDRSERFKIRTWHQWDFLLKTLKTLSQFAATPPSGDINMELMKLFLCLDFNSIHIYAYFLKYAERTTSGDMGFHEQKEQLLYLMKVFKQVRIESAGKYDPRIPSLKDSVVESLTAELSFLESREKLFSQDTGDTKTTAPVRVYFNVAVTLAELMFFFRVMLEVGFMQTKFKSYLYDFISNHIRTQRADNISKKSMRNHFSNKPFPDRHVQNIRNWLGKMVNHIDLYYKP